MWRFGWAEGTGCSLEGKDVAEVHRDGWDQFDKSCVNWSMCWGHRDSGQEVGKKGRVGSDYTATIFWKPRTRPPKPGLVASPGAHRTPYLRSAASVCPPCNCLVSKSSVTPAP